MLFWKLAFSKSWVSAELLRLMVRTESNLFGEITEAQYKEITEIDF